jgi:hypothetical protein
MRARYLSALEEERFDALPGRAYARAFLRTYATSLGLQADEFVAEFDAQQPEPEEEEAVERRPRLPISLRLPVAVPVLAAIAIVAILGWSAWAGGGGPGPTLSTPAPEPAAAAAAPRVQQHVAVAHRATAVLVVRAATGPCWIEARRGGSTGALLAQRTLAQGESATFSGRRIWLRLGAPWNATVMRGTHALRLPRTSGPVDVSY